MFRYCIVESFYVAFFLVGDHLIAVYCHSVWNAAAWPKFLTVSLSIVASEFKSFTKLFNLNKTSIC